MERLKEWKLAAKMTTSEFISTKTAFGFLFVLCKIFVSGKKGECKGATYYGYAIYYRGNGKKDDVKISFTGSAYVDYNLNRTWTQKYKINY